jgi:hypothetical protein
LADDPQVFQGTRKMITKITMLITNNEIIDNIKELVSDLVKKTKEVDTLIEALPGIKHTEEEQVRS